MNEKRFKFLMWTYITLVCCYIGFAIIILSIDPFNAMIFPILKIAIFCVGGVFVFALITIFCFQK